VFRKYSNSLGPDALDFIEQILDEHDITDDAVEFSIDALAKEYNKQDDASMKIDVDVLQRVYESLHDQGDMRDMDLDVLDPESHLHVINAFDMPLWHWSSEIGTFDRCACSAVF